MVLFIERLFPEEKFLQGVVKKDIARLIPNLTAKNIKEQLGDGFVKNLSRTIYRTAKKTLETPLQELTEEEVALVVKKAINGITNPDYEKQELELKEVVEEKWDIHSNFIYNLEKKLDIVLETLNSLKDSFLSLQEKRTEKEIEEKEVLNVNLYEQFLK